MWRKNRARPSSALTSLFPHCTGVDLNRNFGFHWGDVSALHVVGGTQLSCMETYSGPRPFSEPETAAIRDFVMPRKDNIVVMALKSVFVV